MTCPIVHIGRIEIPAAAMRQRAVRLAQRMVRLMSREQDPEDQRTIYGTDDSRRPEIYAWWNPVSPHIDSAGPDPRYGYLCVLLTGGVPRLGAHGGRGCGQTFLGLTRGSVIRLDDTCVHWTTGSGPTVALWLGTYGQPCDLAAVREMKRAVAKLASGSKTAPRLSGHLQTVVDQDRVYVHHPDDFDEVRCVRPELANRLALKPVTCAACDEPAVALDRSYPWSWEGNRCSKHMGDPMAKQLITQEREKSA